MNLRRSPQRVPPAQLQEEDLGQGLWLQGEWRQGWALWGCAGNPVSPPGPSVSGDQGAGEREAPSGRAGLPPGPR